MLVVTTVPIWRWWRPEWSYIWLLEIAGITNLIIRKEQNRFASPEEVISSWHIAGPNLVWFILSSESGPKSGSVLLFWIPGKNVYVSFEMDWDSCPDYAYWEEQAQTPKSHSLPGGDPRKALVGAYRFFIISISFHPHIFRWTSDILFYIVSSLYFVGSKIRYSRFASLPDLIRRKPALLGGFWIHISLWHFRQSQTKASPAPHGLYLLVRHEK